MAARFARPGSLAEHQFEVVDYTLHAGNSLGNAPGGSKIPFVENDPGQHNDTILDRDGDMFVEKITVGLHGGFNMLLHLRVRRRKLLARYYDGFQGISRLRKCFVSTYLGC
jgi:hypothetical protein